jgi:demethylmenaquinone methyltransferase/2-methoxy-6-polyprenyl-1,4-benzoquinol methylase
VPPDKLGLFLEKVGRAVCPGGQMFMVDSRASETSTARDHTRYQADSLYHTCKLNDGREFTVVKVFYQPEHLQAKLAQVGFDARASITDNYFIYAQGVRLEQQTLN